MTAIEDLTEQEMIIASVANHPTTVVEGDDPHNILPDIIDLSGGSASGASETEVDTRNDELDAPVSSVVGDETDESQERMEETTEQLGRGKRKKSKPDRFGEARYNKQTKRYESADGKKVYAQTKKDKGSDDVTVKTSNRSKDRRKKKKPQPTKKGGDATPCRSKHPRPRLGGKVWASPPRNERDWATFRRQQKAKKAESKADERDAQTGLAREE